MNFLNPFFLIGLIAVAIPIVLHLINLRKPRKVFFSTLSFFNELKKSTIRRIRIKQYLLMALRIVALFLLALALARPFLPPVLTGASGSDEPKAVGILIDNSPSMNRIGSQGPLIDQAKAIAKTIIQESRPGDQFIVGHTNGAEESLSLEGRSASLERVVNSEAVNTGNYTRKTLELIYEQLQQSPEKAPVIYLVTDGQASQFFRLASHKDVPSSGKRPITLQILKLKGANQQNLAVSAISLKSKMLGKKTPVTLSVKVKNTGETPAANQFVSMEIEGHITGQYEVSLKPGRSKEYSFQVIPDSAGDLSGKVILEGDEVAYDNDRYFVIHIPSSRSVLLIDEPQSPGNNTGFESYLKPALEASRLTNTQIHLTNKTIKETDPGDWKSYDVIILSSLKAIPEYWFQELQRYVQNGKGLVFFPSEQGDIQNYNSFFRLFNAGSFEGVKGSYASFEPVERMGQLIEGHPVLDELFEKKKDEKIDLDLPELYFFYEYESPGTAGLFNILKSVTGSSLLAEQRFGDGRFLISALGTDPGWSNFPVNPLFAPLYYRSVLYVASSEQGGIEEHILGYPFEWEGAMVNRSVELLKGKDTIKPDVQGIPEGIHIKYLGQEWEPGIVTIKAGGQHRLVAVNQDIMESDFHTLGNKQLDNMLGNSLTISNTIDASVLSADKLNEQLEASGFGKEIWNWFIWGALLFLVAETIVAKLYKAESVV